MSNIPDIKDIVFLHPWWRGSEGDEGGADGEQRGSGGGAEGSEGRRKGEQREERRGRVKESPHSRLYQ